MVNLGRPGNSRQHHQPPPTPPERHREGPRRGIPSAILDPPSAWAGLGSKCLGWLESCTVSAILLTSFMPLVLVRWCFHTYSPIPTAAIAKPTSIKVTSTTGCFPCSSSCKQERQTCQLDLTSLNEESSTTLAMLPSSKQFCGCCLIHSLRQIFLSVLIVAKQFMM